MDEGSWLLGKGVCSNFGMFDFVRVDWLKVVVDERMIDLMIESLIFVEAGFLKKSEFRYFGEWGFEWIFPVCCWFIKIAWGSCKEGKDWCVIGD